MKFAVVSILLLMAQLGLAQSPTRVEIQDSTSLRHIYNQVKVELNSNFTSDTVNQRDPEFPGGMDKLGQYIKENLRYSKTAQAAGLTGRVLVGFLINNQGVIEKIHVVKGISSELDAEAIRLIKSMPNWTPQKINGRAVDCRYAIPINFTLK